VACPVCYVLLQAAGAVVVWAVAACACVCVGVVCYRYGYVICGNCN
jgi:hypothetical protein